MYVTYTTFTLRRTFGYCEQDKITLINSPNIQIKFFPSNNEL